MAKTASTSPIPGLGDQAPPAEGGETITIDQPVATPQPQQADPTPHPAPQPDGETYFTQEQVEAIRRQEKDKLYNKIDSMQSQLDAFNADREEQKRRAEEEAARAEAERKAREEEEMSAKELLARKEDEFEQRLNTAQAEWEERFNAQQAENDAQRAVLEQERKYQELESYKARRLTEEAENIMPDLIDFVHGNTEDEIEASISTAIAKSSAIVESIQQAMPQPRTPVRGIPATGSTPIGPMETQTEQQVLTTQDIQSMSMEAYAQNRERLLAAASRSR